MDDKTRDLLKKVIETYANTPVRNIGELRENIMQMVVEDSEGTIMSLAPGIAHMDFYVELLVKLSEIGQEEAKRIYDNMKEKDDFLKTVEGYEAGPQFIIDRNRAIFDAAFSDLYGWIIATSCPCSHVKAAVLQKNGLVSYNGDLTEVKWINGEDSRNLSCMGCKHRHFTAMLDSLSNGRYDYMEDIARKYSKETTEEAQWWNRKNPLIKIKVQSGYGENRAAFPSYLDRLPCNALIDLLISDPREGSHIKKCVICERYFFANDTRAELCSSDECKTSKERFKKRRQRDKYPGKYGSSKPKESDPAYERWLKLKEEKNVTF